MGVTRRGGIVRGESIKEFPNRTGSDILSKEDAFTPKSLIRVTVSNKLIYILLYIIHVIFKSPFGPAVGTDWFRRAGCPVWQCEVSGRGRGRDNNSNLALPIEEYDAVLFHDPTWFNMSLPAKRSPHQLYVWYNGYLGTLRLFQTHKRR